MPGYFVRAYNEYGHEIPPSTSKVDPPGAYDVPISGGQSLWYVLIVDAANNPLSPVIEIQNTGNFVEGSEGCWHQVDFVRVN